MKVLVDARPLADASSGGVRRVCLGLLPELSKTRPDWEFIFATTGLKKPELPFKLPPNARHLHRTLPNKLVSLLCFFRLTSFDRLFSKERANHLLLCNLGFVGRPNLPYSLLIHDVSFLIEPAWFTRKSRLWHFCVRPRALVENARRIFTVSKTSSRDVSERFSIIPKRMIPLPIGIDALPETQQRLIEKRYVLALGGNDPRKNTGCAIKAVHALRRHEAYQDVRLVLVGRSTSPLTNTRQEIMRFPHPSDAELASLYKYASAFLYPSWYEGFGLPLHEAAQYAAPCIASTAGALPETAPEGTLFASPSKPHLWTHALMEMLRQPDAYRTQYASRDWSDATERLAEALTN